jgi:hypothetical protein
MRSIKAGVPSGRSVHSTAYEWNLAGGANDLSLSSIRLRRGCCAIPGPKEDVPSVIAYATTMDTPRDIPAVLYKYMPAERSKIFDNWLIRFTQPGALNDPFEMRPHIAGYSTPEEVREIASRRWEEYARERYETMARARTTDDKPIPFDVFRARIEPHRVAQIEAALVRSPEYNAPMAARIEELMNKNVCVLSLCEHADSLLMWPHYGDSHRGFVIAFDTSAPFFNQSTPPAHVNASTEEAAQFAEEYGRLRCVCYREERPSAVVTDMTFDTIMTKGKAWEYEGEWRMLMPPDYADVKLPPHLGFPVCLFSVPPSSVKSILLGCNADDSLLACALTLREHPETQHIGIARARVDERHFRLHFEAVE